MSGYDIWSHRQRKDDKWKVYEKRVDGGIFGPNKEEVEEAWTLPHAGEFHCLYSSLLGQLNPGQLDWEGMWYVWEE